MTDWEERFWQLYHEAIAKGLDEDQALERASDTVFIERHGVAAFYGVGR